MCVSACAAFRFGFLKKKKYVYIYIQPFHLSVFLINMLNQKTVCPNSFKGTLFLPLMPFSGHVSLSLSQQLFQLSILTSFLSRPSPFFSFSMFTFFLFISHPTFSSFLFDLSPYHIQIVFLALKVFVFFPLPSS